MFLVFIVRSFGTEEREAAYPILPQPTVYDYILFRGSDIKDIRVVNNVSIPNDPAIMQMHLPPQQPGFPQQMPPIQQAGAPMNQFGPFGTNMQGPPPSANNNAMGTSIGSGQSISQQPSQLQLLSPQSQQQSSSQQGNINLSNILSSTSHSAQTKKSSESKIDLQLSSTSEKPSSITSISQSTSNTHANLLRKQNVAVNKNQGVHIATNLIFPSFISFLLT